MRVVALISGGKDSCYNMMQCVAAGHALVALANLQPQHKDELDSYMYQTVGHQGIDLYAEAMDLPLYREVISGTAVEQGKNYKPTDNDEVEDLYRLLSRVKQSCYGKQEEPQILITTPEGTTTKVCKNCKAEDHGANNVKCPVFKNMIARQMEQAKAKQTKIEERIKRSVVRTGVRYADIADIRLFPTLPQKEPPQQQLSSEQAPPTVSGLTLEGLYQMQSEMDIEAVAVGAILSDYQRVRVENVCRRLGLISIAYLWRRNQKELLQEMISSHVEAIIIKVAALGLDPWVHLGMSIRDIQPHLLLMQEKYGLNVCGEGGEYETFTLDCPLFKKRLVLDEKALIICSDDSVAPVGYLNLKLHLEPKNVETTDNLPPTVKSALDFVNDLSDTVFSDLSDIELSETELESIEKLEKEEKKKHKELNPLLNTEESVDVADHDDESILGYNYDQMHDQSEIQPVLDHSSIFGNSHGWYYIGGIVGEGVDTAIATKDAMKKLINLLNSESLRLEDICSVNIYMRDMGDYAALNDVYVDTFSFVNPPTRVCVQCPLPSDVGLILDAVAHKTRCQDHLEGDSCNAKERVTMHVQGISHWAPANIGPYSQAIKVGEVIGTCGQIALVPGSMTLLEGGARRQCALALRHLTRVVRAVHPRAHIRSVAQSVCYMTHASIAREARRQLERRTAGAIVQYAVVGALPRGAAVEWHAWAHTDNNRFDYEETGCNVGDYKVAITRRWNYENTVAAFVCYVATGSSPSTCQISFPSEEACVSHCALAANMPGSHLEAVLEYALRKLLNDCEERQPTPAVNMRIFYQVWSAPPMTRILSAVEGVRARVCSHAAVTVVPVLALHNAFTFLSISGLRFDE